VSVVNIKRVLPHRLQDAEQGHHCLTVSEKFPYSRRCRETLLLSPTLKPADDPDVVAALKHHGVRWPPELEIDYDKILNNILKTVK